MIRPLLRFFGRLIIRYLNKPILNYRSYQFIPLAELEACLQPGDVLLVEGNQRISSAIKYLTQSTWSHAAYYVGREAGLRDKYGHPAALVEADLTDGVIAASLTKYLGYNTRICRPELITEADRNVVSNYIINSIGQSYDVKNVVDLARYLLPQPPVPVRWRRRMIALGSGEPTQAICSTLIARAFQSVRYPILPGVTRENQREIMHIRHHSLFTPRDFDVSPYFSIVKPTIEKRPDYKGFEWNQERIETDSDETESTPHAS
ncbi:YiiX/YebB-like N1pC/P60 family cysteine hydrolase [Alphaproteobacteria bacterium]|nr:YiiX/YebB-like N1pC/P60 family cysteine hydrolase [Alphaproteobacteria bacterium]MDA8544256.1 YiiX/YebB-like N1pC/P60 family cysteine hydrolase [Alphaproteobacteria bacterium]MDA8623959.1 YiiX/YebB-like N1pC/P60 family cysteine hydrolase [Alphaproteobacteria bacterium]MDA8667176.1 YiiX/YebB-like N1pC/P60 family cysteine hydrolase [Alphaproteobacteria bacterium]MDA9590370.1 YiiX/YebB-like N1pC/P60 family cysteine hydrolase [Alphaproteobacteria bacterium]